VDTLEFSPHNYQMPQLSSTDRLLMAAKYMTYTLQNPHPEVPFTHIGDDTISALTGLANIFKLKLRKNQPSSCASHGQSTPMPRQIIQSNLSCSQAPAASEEITDDNSCSRRNQRAITSEGGQTNDAQSVTSEGAHAITESLSPQLVPRRVLRHGHCPHGHRPWR
jgi:hypothetical protein